MNIYLWVHTFVCFVEKFRGHLRHSGVTKLTQHNNKLENYCCRRQCIVFNKRIYLSDRSSSFPRHSTWLLNKPCPAYGERATSLNNITIRCGTAPSDPTSPVTGAHASYVPEKAPEWSSRPAKPSRSSVRACSYGLINVYSLTGRSEDTEWRYLKKKKSEGEKIMQKKKSKNYQSSDNAAVIANNRRTPLVVVSGKIYKKNCKRGKEKTL